MMSHFRDVTQADRPHERNFFVQVGLLTRYGLAELIHIHI